jgi:hypothetical protein
MFLFQGTSLPGDDRSGEWVLRRDSHGVYAHEVGDWRSSKRRL